MGKSMVSSFQLRFSQESQSKLMTQARLSMDVLAVIALIGSTTSPLVAFVMLAVMVSPSTGNRQGNKKVTHLRPMVAAKTVQVLKRSEKYPLVN